MDQQFHTVLGEKVQRMVGIEYTLTGAVKRSVDLTLRGLHSNAMPQDAGGERFVRNTLQSHHLAGDRGSNRNLLPARAGTAGAAEEETPT